MKIWLYSTILWLTSLFIGCDNVAVGYLYTNEASYSMDTLQVTRFSALENNIPFKAIHIQTKEQAQAVPSPCTSYAMFYNGEFLTNEQFNDKKFLKMVQSK